ncbi:hypothetical protein Ancab_001160, partial [Ancistrocladus abbreviatus]
EWVRKGKCGISCSSEEDQVCQRQRQQKTILKGSQRTAINPEVEGLISATSKMQRKQWLILKQCISCWHDTKGTTPIYIRSP